MALLHKPIDKGLFRNIILKWISLHLKSIVRPIGLVTTKLWSIAETSPFGLIPVIIHVPCLFFDQCFTTLISSVE